MQTYQDLESPQVEAALEELTYRNKMLSDLQVLKSKVEALMAQLNELKN